MLAHALKEWAVAVDALAKGGTIMLLRKGGIREQGGKFSVAYSQVLLYPTYEHQQPHLLKPAYASQVSSVASGWHPSTVQIKAWAEVTDIFQVSDASTMTALLPYHIWNAQFVEERLRWKPRQPVYVLLLRTYRLLQAQTIAYRPEYGGCKSWIELAEPIAIEAAPVLDDRAYARQSAEIQAIVGSASEPQPAPLS